MAVLNRPDTERLFVRSVAIPDRPEISSDTLPQPDAVAWVHHGAGLAGWGEAARVTLPPARSRCRRRGEVAPLAV